MSGGTIIKREGKKGISWLIKYDIGRDPQTGKRRIRYKTIKGRRKDAEKEMRRLLKQVDENTHVDPTKMTTGIWLNYWLENIKKYDVTPKTFVRYCQLLKLHVIPHVGNIPIQKLSGLDIQNVYTKVRDNGGKGEGGLAPRTVHHLHRVLKQALVAAVNKRVISRNPADDVTSPKAPDSKVDTLTDDELTILLKGVQGSSLYTMVVLGSGTGMRLGEMLGLRRSDISFNEKKLRVEQSVEEASGPYPLRFKPPKSKKGRRTITLPNRVVSALRAHLLQQDKDALKCGFRLPEEALVFPISILDPEKPMSPRYISKRFKITALSLGIKLRDRESIHVLRHTHATQLLRNKLNPKVVSERLGHSKVSTTLEIYGHILESDQQEAAEITETILAKALPVA